MSHTHTPAAGDSPALSHQSALRQTSIICPSALKAIATTWEGDGRQGTHGWDGATPSITLGVTSSSFPKPAAASQSRGNLGAAIIREQTGSVVCKINSIYPASFRSNRPAVPPSLPVARSPKHFTQYLSIFLLSPRSHLYFQRRTPHNPPPLKTRLRVRLKLSLFALTSFLCR